MNQPFSIIEAMTEEDRVEECYSIIQDILESYGCEFDCSLTLKNNDQHFCIDVVLKKNNTKAVG